MADCLCIIPARMASSRFSGKPLKPILGLALVLHVFERCRLTPGVGRAVIATCDDAIRRAAEAYGAEAVMTADTHPGCIDRTDEAVGILAPDMPGDGFILMVQGDEVMVTPEMNAAVITGYGKGGAQVVNLASKLTRPEDHDDPNCVKVVAAPDGRAIYFSRAPIPSRARTPGVAMHQQTGVIGFSKDFLKRFGTMPRTPLEVAEGIDMLRTLEHGLPVQMVFTHRETVGVDTPADLTRAEEMLRHDPVTRRYLKF
jgi:3-deoxy-manno-octulosonate cytidylyltransferase (CMP-KDO synthetase)